MCVRVLCLFDATCVWCVWCLCVCVCLHTRACVFVLLGVSDIVVGVLVRVYLHAFTRLCVRGRSRTVTC